MGAAPIGVIANPVAGRDVRRVAAAAAPSTVDHKISVLRRILGGAVAAGADRFVHLPDRYDLLGRAGRTVAGARLEPCDLETVGDESDTIAAAALMRQAGCAVLVVLGGDGTHRAAAAGWPDAPMVTVSVGTNNVFPRHDEPTVAGVAAGLVAASMVDLAVVAPRTKVVAVEMPGAPADLALVDAVTVDERFVGARALLDPARLRLAVVCRAEPAAVGISAVAGLLAPCADDRDGGVAVWFADPDHAPMCVRAPLAPGLVVPVGIEKITRVGLGEVVETTGPAVLALDGERHLPLAPDRPARFHVERRGPRVVDTVRVLDLAAEHGWMVDRDRPR
ncbi:MAG: NAD(+)/NADH kinase [Actinomycetota bacterium]|nr:NAD(+)/NADH kinase [Actinomycetota bacterium]